MKLLLFCSLVLFCFSITGKCQSNTTFKDTVKVIFENEKFIVTEYNSVPGNDVCGIGRHSHKPHLNILLTDASVKLTKDNEKPQVFNLKEGTAFWSEAETHMVFNNGKNPIKLYLIEAK